MCPPLVVSPTSETVLKARLFSKPSLGLRLSHKWRPCFRRTALWVVSYVFTDTNN